MKYNYTTITEYTSDVTHELLDKLCEKSNLPDNKYVFDKVKSYIDNAVDFGINRKSDIIKSNVSFIAKVANYIKEHGNKYDKKFIEDAVWDIAAVYKNEGKSEVAEYLIAQVTDCVAFVPQGENK